MLETPNLKLPYIAPAQAQKHVTHNEAIRALDALVHIAVEDRDLADPPSEPIDGARYIVAGAAAGGWSGRDAAVAAFQDGAWAFYAPREGWSAWVADEDLLVVWDGTAWVAAAGVSDPAPQLGINTSADAVNRLAVASQASLFTHDGGGHQLKIDKAASGDTGAILFQTGWSGRAEMGLAGDDDFHVKVSPDGSAWHEAIVIDRVSGRVSLPATPGREILGASRTYHVDPSGGSDANDGLSPGSSFQTIQKAVESALNIDPAGHAVTIQLADGTYPSGAWVNRPMFDGSQLNFIGNALTPGNVDVAVSGANAFLVDAAGAKVRLEGIRISGDVGVWARYGGVVFLTGRNAFAACAFRHIGADNGAFVEMLGGEVIIDGAAPHHLYADAGGHIFYALGTATVSGSPDFPFGFAYAQSAALVTSYGMTWTGSATGPRYQAVLNGVINVNGGGVSYFPGSSAGVLASGGQYA
ncbi:MAG: DUF2793 domain-containing protein [Hyphomicrobiaceae bacterium]|nr:DUF2793 domain-containing protein [Hyphomicrobiaceae bacterium]